MQSMQLGGVSIRCSGTYQLEQWKASRPWIMNGAKMICLICSFSETENAVEGWASLL